MLVSGRDIVHDRSTACARDACCNTFFPRDNLARRAKDTVCIEIWKARVISTEVQYHFRLKHLVIYLLVTARAYIVRRIALLFLSRGS